jgi:hypothetical protein
MFSSKNCRHSTYICDYFVINSYFLCYKKSTKNNIYKIIFDWSVDFGRKCFIKSTPGVFALEGTLYHFVRTPATDGGASILS